MIIQELCKCIIIDEIRQNANSSEIYFLSCLLGNEMLCIPEDWPGRIYTSQFIYDILLKKKPKVNPKCFRVLKANVPTKFKSKDKLIWVTMFELDEIKNNVMFYFDDENKKYLYVGAFNDITSCYSNENFMLCVRKGIDYVYIDTLLSNSNPFICAEGTVDEIKTISQKHPNSRLALIMPNFGYEKLLIQLAQTFPKTVYPTKTQRYILTKLGYADYLAADCQSCKIVVFIPGILTECLEGEFIIIYITVGDASTLNNEYGVLMRQWSPVMPLMDQQVLLEMIKPNHIIPIENNNLLSSTDLPFNLRSLVKNKPLIEFEPELSDTETWPENSSIESIGTKNSAFTENYNCETNISLPSTKLFCPQTQSTELPKSEQPKDIKEDNEVLCTAKANTESSVPVECINLVKNRVRLIRRRSIVFSDSSDEDI